jgi:hypothetical protein
MVNANRNLLLGLTDYCELLRLKIRSNDISFVVGCSGFKPKENGLISVLVDRLGPWIFIKLGISETGILQNICYHTISNKVQRMSAKKYETSCSKIRAALPDNRRPKVTLKSYE